MLITHVVGARPNFMKAAPVLAALAARGLRQRLVHTGQHYDRAMSDVFFDELGLPEPDANLGVGSGTHAVQTAETMVRLEREFEGGPDGDARPGLVLVYGDVNSTVAAALVAAKLGIPVGHVEAGLRSRDRRMPEEVNRLVTDRLAALLFTPSVDGNENLAREGVDPGKVHLVGNVMVDTLDRLLPEARARWARLAEAHGTPGRPLARGRYALVTLHRPSTVDDPAVLRDVVGALGRVAERAPVLFPVHPRTRARLAESGLGVPEGVRLLDPVGYLAFLALQDGAGVVVTDSGGVQEETTALGVPCLTVRENTERPVTVWGGTNRLVGHDVGLLERLAVGALDAAAEAAADAAAGEAAPGGSAASGSADGPRRVRRPLLWDGRAGERVADVVEDWAEGRA